VLLKMCFTFVLWKQKKAHFCFIHFRIDESVRKNIMQICGATFSRFCLILSAWGIIQLAVTGILFHIRSASLIEDVTLERDVASVEDFANYIDVKYEIGALNCWVASLLYVATFCFSAKQFYTNKNSVELKQ